MKTVKFEDGDVFEIFLSKNLFAYCRVIGRSEFSPMFELFDGKFAERQELDDLEQSPPKRTKVAYINKHSLKDKKKARFVGNMPLSAKARRHPPIFKGDPHSSWIVFGKNGTKQFSPNKVSYQKLVDKGYVDYTIYPSEDLVSFYLKGKPLAFKPFSTNLASS